jgi:hypothetical protein
MADSYSKYKVPRVAEQLMRVPKAQGGATDVLMKNPAKVGAQKNPGASDDPMFDREFNAEKDFQALLTANQIRANKARLGKAIQAGERLVSSMGIKLTNAGGNVNERKGANNQGVRTRANNPFDHLKQSGGNTGMKMDGQKGRW